MDKIDIEYMPVWRRYLEQIECAKLTDTDLGTLFRAMMKYQFEGIEPEDLNSVLQVFWAFFRSDLDHARERYETAVKNGKKGGRKKKQKPEETQENQTEGISITESISESKSITESESISETKKAQAASAEAEVSVSQKAYGEFGWVKLSDQEYSELKQEMGEQQLKRCITYIDESAQSTGNRNHWVDWRTVLRRCYQKRWHETSSPYAKPEIPKGASGELGAIELQAIQKLLAT